MSTHPYMPASPQTSAIQAFQELHATLRADAQALIRKLDAMHDLLTANQQVLAAANAAAPGAIIGNTAMTKEEVLMGLALITSLRTYIDTDLVPGISMRNAVYRLG